MSKLVVSTSTFCLLAVRQQATQHVQGLATQVHDETKLCTARRQARDASNIRLHKLNESTQRQMLDCNKQTEDATKLQAALTQTEVQLSKRKEGNMVVPASGAVEVHANAMKNLQAEKSLLQGKDDLLEKLTKELQQCKESIAAKDEVMKSTEKEIAQTTKEIVPELLKENKSRIQKHESLVAEKETKKFVIANEKEKQAQQRGEMEKIQKLVAELDRLAKEKTTSLKELAPKGGKGKGKSKEATAKKKANTKLETLEKSVEKQKKDLQMAKHRLEVEIAKRAAAVAAGAQRSELQADIDTTKKESVDLKEEQDKERIRYTKQYNENKKDTKQKKDEDRAQIYTRETKLTQIKVSGLQVQQLIQLYTNTDYCLVSFCTWILTTTGSSNR
jgi:hypothetical protein